MISSIKIEEILMFEKYYSNRINTCVMDVFEQDILSKINEHTISFMGGKVNLFPEYKEMIYKAFNKAIPKSFVFQYASPYGNVNLRKYIAHRYNTIWNFDNLTEDNIIITTGSTQALDLIGKVFLNDNDNVLVENPSYIYFADFLKMYRANTYSVSLNSNGLNSDELSSLLSKHNFKMAYLIPNIQNPTTITYSKQNRTDIFEIIKDKDLILVQDNTYGELDFEDKRLPFIGQNSRASNIYIGSFSKILGGGLRLGYAIADKEIIDKLAIAKQTSDIHSENIIQYVISEYLLNNDFDTYLKKLKLSYKQQRNIMLNAINEMFPKEIECSEPEGGIFLWLTLPSYLSGLELLKKTIEQNVLFMPGEYFTPYETFSNKIRLGYTNIKQESVIEGVRIMASVLKENMR